MSGGKYVYRRFWPLWTALSGLCWSTFALVWIAVPYWLFGWRGLLVAIPMPFACVLLGVAGMEAYDRRRDWVTDNASNEKEAKRRWHMSIHPTILTARGFYFFAMQTLFLAVSLTVGPNGSGFGTLDTSLIFASMGCAAMLPGLYNETAKRYLLWASCVLYALGIIATSLGIALYGWTAPWR